MTEAIEVIFERYADAGFCLSLVFDDDGRWAVSDSGTSPITDSDNGHTQSVSIVSWVEPDHWRPTIREAVDTFIAAHPLASQHATVSP